MGSSYFCYSSLHFLTLTPFHHGTYLSYFICFKFYVLREINSWLVKVTLYDSTYKLCVEVCRAQLHSFIINQHSRGMLSSSVTALRAWNCDGYIHFHLCGILSNCDIRVKASPGRKDAEKRREMAVNELESG